jgi:hypothetical protein
VPATIQARTGGDEKSLLKQPTVIAAVITGTLGIIAAIAKSCAG